MGDLYVREQIGWHRCDSGVYRAGLLRAGTSLPETRRRDESLRSLRTYRAGLKRRRWTLDWAPDGRPLLHCCSTRGTSRMSAAAAGVCP